MPIRDVLAAERIALDITASSKKNLLETAAELLAGAPGAAGSREIFETLCKRERLGSTGLGDGVAIPHGRVDGQPEAAAAMIRLKRPIAFDAPDGQSVDLFLALAVPTDCTNGHLQLLAKIAELFSDPARREAIRRADSTQAVLDLVGAS